MENHLSRLLCFVAVLITLSSPARPDVIRLEGSYPFTAPAAWQIATNPYPLSLGFGASALYGSSLHVFGGTATGVSPERAEHRVHDLPVQPALGQLAGSYEHARRKVRACGGHDR